MFSTIEQLLNFYPPPTHLRMAIGLEFVANSLARLECWERLHMAYIPPGSPGVNPCVESFYKGLRYEILNIQLSALCNRPSSWLNSIKLSSTPIDLTEHLQGFTTLEVRHQWKAA